MTRSRRVFVPGAPEGDQKKKRIGAIPGSQRQTKQKKGVNDSHWVVPKSNFQAVGCLRNSRAHPSP